LVLRRRQAERVRIEFEPAASAARGQFGTSLILTRDNVARILPVPRGKSHPPIAFGDLVSVQIIRGLRQWTILVDDHTAATLPVARTAVAPPHIRVTVEGGPALFSDLSVAYRVDEKPTAAK
jgi:hypothetical protein